MDSLAKKFLLNKKGTIAIMFSIALLPVLLSVAVAVDYTRIYRVETQMQDSLDSAVLATTAISNGGTKEFAMQFYGAQNTHGVVTKYQKRNSSNGMFVLLEAEYNVPTIFAKLYGQESMPVKVRSEAVAPNMLSSLRFRIDSANGELSKDVILKGYDKVTGKRVNLLNMAYRYPPRRFASSNSGWIDISGYERLYMVYYIKKSSYHYRWYCGYSGRKCPVVRSNDQKYSNRIGIDGVQQRKNIKLDIFGGLGCNETRQIGWEDLYPRGYRHMDFFFKLEGKCSNAGTRNNVRLTQ